MMDLPTVGYKISFFLDRKQHFLSVDIKHDGVTSTINLESNDINEESTIRSLAILFQKNHLTLFVDCKEATKLQMDIGLTKLYFQMEEPVIKLVSKIL